MAITVEHNLHFRCFFRLVPADPKQCDWTGIVKMVRQWIEGRLRATGIHVNSAIGGSWLVTGGEWKSSGPARAVVKTATAASGGTDAPPRHWALRYEVPDGSVKFRRWRTDIGLSALSDTEWQFSLTTVNWLLPGYIGKEPPPAVPTAPAIVSMLARSGNWLAYAGDQRLSADPIIVPEGRANELVDRLESSNRDCPLIVVSRSYASGAPLVDSKRLAKLLCGTACVYEYSSTLLDRELEYFLDFSYRCQNGMVRVYQPRLLPNPRRHRYLTRGEIEELGGSNAEDLFIRALARRPQLSLGKGVHDLEDVIGREREEKLVQLRGSSDLAELVPLYEQENNQLLEKIKKMEAEVTYWKGLSEELDESQDDVRRLENEKRILETRAMAVEDELQSSQKAASAAQEMENLPNSVADVVNLIAKAYAGRVLFTDKARESARNAKLKNPNIAWRVLRAMATRLYDLHFDDEKYPFREISEKFRSQTGFEVAITESERTRDNRKLAAKRMDVYKGHKIDITPHVKYGRDPGNSLRVHYCALAEEKLLVIGHCGDHLDTFRTN